MHREKIINAFVLEKDGKITDFISFYHLPSSILKKNTKHKEIKAGYCYYLFNTVTDIKTMFIVALHKAKEKGYDVFNVLDIMKNEEIFKELKFGGGTGYLNYYFYN